MEIDNVVIKFKAKPYLLNMGAGKLSKMFGCSRSTIVDAKSIARESQNNPIIVDSNIVLSGKRILVIGDTHIPYELDGYLEFCKLQYDLNKCDTVIHIGDLIDSHATSRHPSIPDAYSPGDELDYTIKKLRKWYLAFPNMKVCIGNHDMRVNKLAAEAKVASKWIRGYEDVLEVPTWEFRESFEIGDTFFTHGTGTTGMTAAYTRALNLGMNVVIGHVHTEASIIYHKLRDKSVFGMLVGCGVNQDSYGMNYAKNYPKKSIISCGLVIDGEPRLKIM